MKKFVMEKPFLELFPDCEIGILVCNGINNQPTDEEKYAPWLRENEKIAAKYFKAEEWTENPVVSFSPLKKGTEIGVCDEMTDLDYEKWYYIEFEGRHGFVCGKYVERV